MTAENDQLVASLVAMTGVSAGTARELLMLSRWDLEVALDLHLNGAGSAAASGPSIVAPLPIRPPPSAMHRTTAALAGGTGLTPPPTPPAVRPPAGGGRAVGGGGIRTLGDMNRPQEAGPGEQDMYAGGDRSGVSIRMPGRTNDDEPQGGHRNLIRDLLALAQAGSQARGGDADDEDAPARPAMSSFTGAGRTLGQAAAAHPAQAQQPPRASVAEDFDGSEDEGGDSADGASLTVVKRRVTLWRNGFSVEDGPLLPFSDPRNIAILEAMRNGIAPLDVLGVTRGQAVDVAVDDRNDEDYTAGGGTGAYGGHAYGRPAAAPPAFGGVGRTLGVPSASNIAAATGTATPVSTQSPRTAAPSNEAKFSVNADLPQTSIQIRLGDGTRLIVRLNHTHTIGDVHRYIVDSRPDPAARRFVLRTTMPPRELSDHKATVAEAGILGSVVMQHFVKQ